jgi:hypothetical protein
MMARYWRLIELAVHGPFGMLVVQSTLFLWGLYRVLRLRLPARRAAWAAAALMLFPPILTPMAPVWKDAQMAAFLLAGLVLALQPHWHARVIGCVLFVLACGVRDNGFVALPPLCVFVVAHMPIERRVARLGLAALLSLALPAAAMLINARLVDHHTHPWARSVGAMDLAGIVCLSGPIDDPELERDLAWTGHVEGVTEGIQHKMCGLYSPREWFTTSAYFDEMPTAAQVAARRRAWWRLVKKHPAAYLEHRTRVMAELLGLSDDDVWEPVCQNSAVEDQYTRLRHFTTPSYVQRLIGRAFARLGQTMLFRPWVYAVLSLVFFGWALVRRHRLILALVGSGLLYEASFFVGAAAPDYRYSHWMITLCCLSAVLIGFEKRASPT